MKPENDTLQFDQLLRNWRTENQITQREAAERLNVPCRTYQKWEFPRELNIPRGTTLLRVLAAIQTKPKLSNDITPNQRDASKRPRTSARG